MVFVVIIRYGENGGFSGPVTSEEPLNAPPRLEVSTRLAGDGFEIVILCQTGQRGIRALFVQDELLHSCLALSHSSSVAITTGFPTHYMHRYMHIHTHVHTKVIICYPFLLKLLLFFSLV